MLCVHIPGFLVAVHRQDQPGSTSKPVAILGDKQRVVQASLEALEGGVRPGMTDVQARATLAGVACVELAEKAARGAFDALLARLLQLAPRVEAGAPGLAYLDTHGLGRLYGKLETLVEKVLETVRRQGFEAGVGVARSKLVARLAALHGPGAAIVPPARERAFLDPLPLGALEMPEELGEQLFLLGIHTLGQFARLDGSAIANRYGSEGCRLHRMAGGHDDEPFRPWQPVPEWVEELALDFPLTEIDRLLFLLTLPLEKLLERLAAEGLACQELLVELGLEEKALPADGRRLALAVAPGTAPDALARTYLDLLRLELERRPTAAAVERVRLQVAAAASPHAEQGRLFDRTPPRTAAVAAAISKLAARLGPEAVFSPELVDTWRPEKGWKTEGPKEKKEEKRKKKPPAEQPPLFGATVEAPPPGLRMLRVPEPARVRHRDGRLLYISWNDVSSPVASASGPWSLSGEWWADGYDREYHEVETASGWRLWLYRDRLTGDWFVQGALE